MAAPPVLGFELAADRCAAAVVAGGVVLAAAEEPARGAGQEARLVPFLETVLAGAGAGWRDLGGLGVGTGPGGYAGLRIAVSAARGLALGLGVPAAGVSRFEALAEGLGRPLLAAVAGRAGTVWLCRLDGAGPAGGAVPGAIPAARDGALPPGLAGSGLDVVGDEAARLAALTGGRALAPALPGAVAVARLAAARIAAGLPLPRPAPVYPLPAEAAPAAPPPPLLAADGPLR